MMVNTKKITDIIVVLIGVLLLVIFTFSYISALGLIKPNISYREKQFWWFIWINSIVGLILCYFLAAILDKKFNPKYSKEALEKRKNRSKRESLCRGLLIGGGAIYITSSIIVFYLYSLLPEEDSQSIMMVSSPIALILYIIFWVGIVITIIGFGILLSGKCGKNEIEK